MELWDLYDRDRNLLGRTHVRGDLLGDGEYHLAVHVWIKDREGRYLISRRAASREKFPDMYECVGGSVLAGEDSLQGAVRETKEEVGVDLDVTCGEVLFSRVRGRIDGRTFNDIMDCWLFRYDGEVDLSLATTDEVSSVQWLTVDEIRVLHEANELVPTLSYFFDKVAKK